MTPSVSGVRNYFVPVLVAVSLIVLLTAAGQSGAASVPNKPDSLKCHNGHILVGVAKGFSGGGSFFDIAGWHGLQLALRNLNAAGGIHGCKFTWITGDTQSSPSVGAQVATELINKGAQILVVPDDFDLGVGAALVGEKAGLLTISGAASSTQFGTAVGPHFFNGGIDTTTQGYWMGKFALNHKWTKGYVVLDTTLAYFTLQDKEIRTVFAAAGAHVLGEDVVKSLGTTADFSSTISKIQAAKPTVIFGDMTFPAIGSFVKQLRAAGINTPVVSNTPMATRDFPKLVGKSATKNCYYVAQLFFEGTKAGGVDSAMLQYDSQYTKLFGHFPEQENGPASYQMFYAIAQALKQPGVVDANTAAKAISAERNLQVPGGTMVEWHNGYAVWNPTIVGFQNGQFHKIGVFPASGIAR